MDSVTRPARRGRLRPHGVRYRRKTSQDKRTARALWTLPLAEADIAAFGEHSPYIQDIVTHDATSPRWDGIDHSHRVADVTVPASSVGGWYDIFVMGEDAWRSFDSWPPAGYSPQRFHLGAAGALTSEPPAESSVGTYRYDPADPTPTVGGVRLAVGVAGRAENTELEARPDVLTYTTPVLDQDVEVVGEVSAEIRFSSSLPHADVFVRLCDVDQDGRSWNVCDGLVSLSDAAEPQGVVRSGPRGDGSSTARNRLLAWCPGAGT